MISVPLWPTVFILPLGLCFYYFILAGARTFEVSPDDDLGSGIAQFSFLVTGTLATLFLGYRAHVPMGNAVAGGALMAAALTLYEWARHTIADRRFHIAWNGEVPEAVCEDGPYAHIRHPIYASYLIAFAAMLAALPSLWSLAIFLLNASLFVHAARDDERSMAGSDLAPVYARYKRRTGMFLPRFWRKAVG
uniref:methyltransferase family protein n=1 Tax=Altererythrobacter segetis TaxID=1104773 RepID=UPI00140ADDF3|nr:isoprenylcysteine carboxylmethyltransferase family protein [Altererythrobacter segetis]